ncbi:hypothetical protein KFK09_017716 [Dendrobium nobile]|uniref:RNase H type-1 domain-containing protein n=1 Tax=Dendrobium nobile TaxID=94219 RepID=A0A8T3AUW4_DENNO|nr:hypothetical protein KFK09_017716 [Dendrobium nobile]
MLFNDEGHFPNWIKFIVDAMVRDYRCSMDKYKFTFLNASRIHHSNVYRSLASWICSNAVKHGKSASSVPVSATNVLYVAINNANPVIDSWGANLPREFQNSWHPPPQDWIKINVDASLMSSYMAGIGACFRDHKGRLLIAFGEKRTHWDIAHLEMEAIMILRRFIQPWMLEYKGVIIEGDNINVIKFIKDSLNKNKWQKSDRVEEDFMFLTDFNKSRTRGYIAPT